jgi:hypothetical protein
MGWWDMPGGEGVMGDDPADELRRTLKRLGAGGTSPTVKEGLAAVEAALRQDPAEIFEPARTVGRLVLELKDGGRVSSEETARAGDAQTVRDGLVAAGLSWRTDFGRKPTLAELLYALSFVWRSRPERFFSDGADWPISSVQVE